MQAVDPLELLIQAFSSLLNLWMLNTCILTNSGGAVQALPVHNNDNPVNILYKSIAGRYRPVRVADGPITARYRFIKNASWEGPLLFKYDDREPDNSYLCILQWKLETAKYCLAIYSLADGQDLWCLPLRVLQYHIQPNYSTYPCKYTVKQFLNLEVDYRLCMYIYFFYESIYCGFSFELPRQVQVIQMNTHNICFYK